MRAYKRVSEEQCKVLSDVLTTVPAGQHTKKPKVEGDSETVENVVPDSAQWKAGAGCVQITGCTGVTINYCK